MKNQQFMTSNQSFKCNFLLIFVNSTMPNALDKFYLSDKAMSLNSTNDSRYYFFQVNVFMLRRPTRLSDKAFAIALWQLFKVSLTMTIVIILIIYLHLLRLRRESFQFLSGSRTTESLTDFPWAGSLATFLPQTLDHHPAAK